MDKIIPFPQLKNRLTNISRPLVLVGGCFDILHYGHVKFLTIAKNYGQVLVALESDANVIRRKGVARPIHKEHQRAEVLASLTMVDYVLMLPELTKDEEYNELVKSIRPDVIAITKGDKFVERKRAQAKSVGAKLVEIPKTATPSTTQLIKLLELETA